MITKHEFRKQLEQVTPEVPEIFHNAMTGTLRTIVAGEKANYDAQPAKRTGGMKRKTMMFVILGTLLLASVALAATLLAPDLFDILIGTKPQNAESLMQYDLAKESFDECDIEIKQAAYDGMSLYVVYSIRERAATECLGEYDPITGTRYAEDIGRTEAMKRDGIGYWSDSFWIDGKEVSMPGGSYGQTIGSETPGELLTYYTFRLDNSGLYLNSKETKVSLPIGKRDPDEKLIINKETGEIAMPKSGLVTFTIDTTSRAGVKVSHPNIENSWDIMEYAKASEVTYTPLMMYITLDVKVRPEAIEAYKKANGEGYLDEQGNLMWAYSGMDVYGSWCFDLELVDGSGKRVFEDLSQYGYIYGNQGSGDEQLWFLYPYMEKYPDEMWIAPVDENGVADMTKGVRVK